MASCLSTKPTSAGLVLLCQATVLAYIFPFYSTVNHMAQSISLFGFDSLTQGLFDLCITATEAKTATAMTVLTGVIWLP